MYKKYIKKILSRLGGVLICGLWSQTLWAEISVVDDLGQRLVLTKPAQRIISLAPHVTENLYAVGAGDLVVGAVAYSDYPPAAKALPQVGDFANLNIERILTLKPDLVVAWIDGTAPGQIARLEQLGIPVLQESPDSFPEIALSLRRLGIVSGRQASAEKAAAAMEARVQRLRERYASAPVLSVFYQLWHQPLITANDTQLIDQIIQLCGGRNLFAERPEVAPRIGVEAVIAANPDLILSAVERHNPDWQKVWQPWQNVTAVRNGHLFSVEADHVHRATVRAVEGAEQVCAFFQQAREQRYPQATGTQVEKE